MPRDSEHIDLATHNIETSFYLFSGGSKYCDWTATTAFYAALHIIDAILFKHHNKKHGQTHGVREAILKAKSYQHIYKHYRELSSASKIARYLTDGSGHSVVFEDYMSQSTVKDILIKHHLQQIIKSAKNFLDDASFKKLNSAISVFK